MKNLKIITLLFISTLIWFSCTSNDNPLSGGNCATECSYTIASGEIAGTVPSSLDGTYNLTYHSAQTGSPFTNGTTATFTVANNELTVEINGE